MDLLGLDHRVFLSYKVSWFFWDLCVKCFLGFLGFRVLGLVFLCVFIGLGLRIIWTYGLKLWGFKSIKLF